MSYADYASEIQAAAKTYGGKDAGNFGATLAWLLAEESDYNPTAGNKSGALGIAQFMPETAKQYGLIVGNKDNRTNPHLSIDAAARLLRDNYNYFAKPDANGQIDPEAWVKAVAAYNAGAGTVDNAAKARTQVATGVSRSSTGGKLRTVAGEGFGGGWTDYLPKETQQYVSDFTQKLVHDKPNSDVTALWKGQVPGGYNSSTAGVTTDPRTGAQIPPRPTLDQFQGDYDAFITAQGKWEQLYGSEAGYRAQAAKDAHASLLLNELASQISAGQLSLDAATKNFQNYVTASTFDYGDQAQKRVASALPTSAQYIPGTEPGNALGLASQPVQLGNTFNPFKTAMNLQSHIPDVASIVSQFTNPANVTANTGVDNGLAGAGTPDNSALMNKDAGTGYNAFRSALGIIKGLGASSGSPAAWTGSYN